jgi:hypothetical protein
LARPCAFAVRGWAGAAIAAALDPDRQRGEEVDQQVTDRHGVGAAGQAFGLTMLAHVLSAACFLALVAADLDGCDKGDGAAGALAMATTLDLVLATVVLVVLHVRRPVGRRQVRLGWAAGLIPALAAVVVAAIYVESLGTGCPV